MIYLQYDIENTIVTTLTENETTISTAITATTYVLEITNEQSGDVTNFDLTDVSTYTDRFNEFKLSIDSTLAAGFYRYRMYLKDVDTELMINNVLEIGKCLVQKISESEIQYNKIDDTIVYEKNN